MREGHPIFKQLVGGMNDARRKLLPDHKAWRTVGYAIGRQFDDHGIGLEDSINIHASRLLDTRVKTPYCFIDFQPLIAWVK